MRIATLARDRWDSMRSPRPASHAAAERAIVDLYQLVELRPPRRFIWYPSPAAAFDDYARWRTEKGRVTTCYWSYQLPLCDPASYFRSWGKTKWALTGTVDLAVRRRANNQGALVFIEPIKAAVGDCVATALLDRAWRALEAELPPSYCDAASAAVIELFGNVMQDLDIAMGREDPTFQGGVDDFIFLGPLRWLVMEAVCVTACREVLGARTNSVYVDAIAGVADRCGPVYAFGDLCVMSETPTVLRPPATTEAGVVEFADGWRIAWP